MMCVVLAGGGRSRRAGADEGRLRDAGDESARVDPEQVRGAQRPPLPQQSGGRAAGHAQVQELPHSREAAQVSSTN